MTLRTRVALILSFVTLLAIVYTFWQAGHSRVVDGSLPLQFVNEICKGNVQDVSSLYLPQGMTQAALSQAWQDYLGTFQRGCTAQIDVSNNFQVWMPVSDAADISSFKAVPINLVYPPERGISTLPISVTLVQLSSGETKVWPYFSAPFFPKTGRVAIESAFALPQANFEVTQPAIAFRFRNSLYVGIPVQISPIGHDLTSFSARLYSYAKSLTEARGVGDVNELPQKYHGAFSTTDGRRIDKSVSPSMWLWYAFDDDTLFNPDRLYLGMQVTLQDANDASQTAFAQVAVDQRPSGQSPLYNTRLSVVTQYDVFQQVKPLKSQAASTDHAASWQFTVSIDTTHLPQGQQVALACSATLLYLDDDTAITPQSCAYDLTFASGEKRNFTLTFQLDNPGVSRQAVRLEYRWYLEGIEVPVTIWQANF